MLGVNCQNSFPGGSLRGMKKNPLPPKPPEWAERINTLLKSRAMTQADLARVLDVSRQHLNGVFKGRIQPGRQLLEGMAEVFGLGMAGLFGMAVVAPRVAEEPAAYGEFFPVSFVEAVPSMGGGSLVVEKTVKSHLAFRRDWLYGKGNAARMVAMKALGTSMGPTIPDGAIVLVDEGQTELVSGRIYLITWDGQLKVKRLAKKGQEWFVVSDATPDKPEPVGLDDQIEVHGRVIWYGMDLT